MLLLSKLNKFLVYDNITPKEVKSLIRAQILSLHDYISTLTDYITSGTNVAACNPEHYLTE